MYDWEAIRARYIAGETISQISRAMNGRPSLAAISRRAKAGKWAGLRQNKTRPPVALRPDQAEVKEQVLDYLRKGATLALAAKAAGISESTLANWRKQNSEFAALCEQAQGKCVAAHLAVINDLSLKSQSLRAAQFMVERHPLTRGDYNAPTGTGPGGVQIVLNIPRTEAESARLASVQRGVMLEHGET